ncbi:unnamed protein product [Adineta steineri]|uniref:Uncharacterized protein n=1 Tax=Adineta steineri TaxID=433720 RepID=A0A814SFF4_9BILA|nr:unnamed protein product [Adineta steineri]
MDASKSNDTTQSKQLSFVLNDVTVRQRTDIEGIQNILLVWLDNNIDNNNTDCCNTVEQLKRIVPNINAFTDDNKCIQFIQTNTDRKIYIIISDTFGKQVVPRIHDISQVDAIFIFGKNKESYEKWVKIKGVFTELPSLCEALEQTIDQYEQNMIPISFIAKNIADQSSNTIFNLLDSSFIFIRIIKEILLTIDFGEIHLEEFIFYCRDVFADDDDELDNVDQLNSEYYSKKPIWWYTQKSFLYHMLNRAIRSLDIGVLVRMGFFIDDLHRNIQRLHSEQIDDDDFNKSFTVYRGQSLSKRDFERMKNIKDGFISFNNFLLTTKNRDISLDTAQQAAINPDVVGIVFVVNVDAAQSTTPFASITDVSYFHIEDEVLFSIQTIFQIGNIKPIDTNKHLYEVTLTLTSDDEKELRKLTDRIQQETLSDQQGWVRLGQVLLTMNQIEKAQDVYEILLDQTNHETEKAPIYYQLGWIKNHQKEYQDALTFYEKSLSINQDIYAPDNINFATLYRNISALHYIMGNYPKALYFSEKALEIKQKSLSRDDLELGNAYHDVGIAHNGVLDYPEALSSHEEALRIRQQALPSNHPDLIASYNNIGMVNFNMGNYSKALATFEKAFKIQQQSLPPNHPDLTAYYNNIGMVYNNMSDYSKALSSYEKALEIQKKTLPPNHPSLAVTYNNIGTVYLQLGDYPKALSSYEKTLQIRQQNLPPNHPELGDAYHNIGIVHNSMNNYPKAISSYQKSIEIKQQSLPSKDPSLGTSYNNIGIVYISMADFPKALQSHENALQIRQQSLPPSHPDLAMSFGYIGKVYNSMGEYSKALSYCQRAIDISQQTLPPDHPHFQWYRNILQDIQKNL